MTDDTPIPTLPIAPEAMHSPTYIHGMKTVTCREDDDGGQHLIAADIAACFVNCDTIYIPYPCQGLAAFLKQEYQKIIMDGVEGADGIYWGTPTIVNDKALFPKCLRLGDTAEFWTKENERTMSKLFTSSAEYSSTVRVIVTGLGTGDISTDERLEDMNGGRIVSYKQFEEFEDWVLMRTIDRSITFDEYASDRKIDRVETPANFCVKN